MITLYALMLMSQALFAKIITVNNSILSAGQYSDLQLAINAAATGDTLYVHASPTTYGNATMAKRLTIFGAGYYNPKTQNQWYTTIGTLTLDSLVNSTSASGSSFQGLRMGYLQTASGKAIQNVIIDRTYVSSTLYITGRGWTLKNSVIANLYINNNENILITNNIMDNFYNSNKATVVIDHNIIFNSYSGISFAIITNNVFYYANVSYLQYITNSTFNNNIGVFTTAAIFPPATSSGSGNIIIDPEFEGTSANNLNTASIFLVNLRLKSSSPGKNYGTDGSDVGIYGGMYPMPNLTGEPRLPQITEFNIQNAVVPKDGTIKVQVKARKVN